MLILSASKTGNTGLWTWIFTASIC